MAQHTSRGYYGRPPDPRIHAAGYGDYTDPQSHGQFSSRERINQAGRPHQRGKQQPGFPGGQSEFPGGLSGFPGGPQLGNPWHSPSGQHSGYPGQPQFGQHPGYPGQSQFGHHPGYSQPPGGQQGQSHPQQYEYPSPQQHFLQGPAQNHPDRPGPQQNYPTPPGDHYPRPPQAYQTRPVGLPENYHIPPGPSENYPRPPGPSEYYPGPQSALQQEGPPGLEPMNKKAKKGKPPKEIKKDNKGKPPKEKTQKETKDKKKGNERQMPLENGLHNLPPNGFSPQSDNLPSNGDPVQHDPFTGIQRNRPKSIMPPDVGGGKISVTTMSSEPPVLPGRQYRELSPSVIGYEAISSPHGPQDNTAFLPDSGRAIRDQWHSFHGSHTSGLDDIQPIRRGISLHGAASAVIAAQRISDLPPIFHRRRNLPRIDIDALMGALGEDKLREITSKTKSTLREGEEENQQLIEDTNIDHIGEEVGPHKIGLAKAKSLVPDLGRDIMQRYSSRKTSRKEWSVDTEESR